MTTRIKYTIFVFMLAAMAASVIAADTPLKDFSPFQVPSTQNVTRYSEPIMSASPEEGDVCNPTVIPVGDRLAMLYRYSFRGSKIGLAFSDDGRNFIRSSFNPVLTPGAAYDERACEDPRVVKFGALYYLTYDGLSTNGMQQCLATSPDLIHWDKKGVCLHPQGWCGGLVKAAVIVPEQIGGKYIMYFLGQQQAWHTQLGIAVSDDLLHWSQPLDHPIMEPRPDYFDSLGVEPGATPIVLKEGILLIYNGWNPGRTHRTGWVLFSKDDPSKILKRCEQPFIEPTFPYEKHQPPSEFNVTFTEGAVFYKGLWRFYYGAEDHSIGLAEMPEVTNLFKQEKTE
jgi:predicted GH43/DUF377 family glycosyl hydrolase